MNAGSESNNLEALDDDAIACRDENDLKNFVFATMGKREVAFVVIISKFQIYSERLGKCSWAPSPEPTA